MTALMLAGTLAACGNPAPASTSPEATPSASPSARPSAAPYMLGMLASLSGPYAERGIAARDGAQLAAKQVNDLGGIGGHPLQLLVEDDRGDPSQAVVAFKDLVNQDAVAIVGPEVDATAVAVLPLVDQVKVPAISLTSDQAQSQPVHRFMFVMAPPPSLLAAGLLSYLQRTNVKTIGVLREDTAFGNEGIQQLRQLAGKFDVQVLADETYQITDTDMTRQLTNLKDNPALQAVVGWASPGAAAAILTKQFRETGIKVPLLLTAMQGDPGYLQASGSAANGVVLETNKPPLFKYLLPSDPSYQRLSQFLPAYKQAAGKEPGRFAALGYDAVGLLAQAMGQAGAQPESLGARLEKSSFNGVSGPYVFSSSSHAGMQAAAIAMATVQNGAFLPVKPSCDGCGRTTVTAE